MRKLTCEYDQMRRYTLVWQTWHQQCQFQCFLKIFMVTHVVWSDTCWSICVKVEPWVAITEQIYQRIQPFIQEKGHTPLVDTQCMMGPQSQKHSWLPEHLVRDRHTLFVCHQYFVQFLMHTSGSFLGSVISFVVNFYHTKHNNSSHPLEESSILTQLGNVCTIIVCEHLIPEDSISNLYNKACSVLSWQAQAIQWKINCKYPLSPPLRSSCNTS